MKKLLILWILFLSIIANGQQTSNSKIDFKIYPLDSVKEVQYMYDARKGNSYSKNGKVDYAFWKVDENALFQGNDIKAFQSLVEQNFVFPKNAIGKIKNGIVSVIFCINKKGKMCNIMIANKLHPSIDKEVVRVVMSAHTWTPAKCNNEIVNQWYSIKVNVKSPKM